MQEGKLSPFLSAEDLKTWRPLILNVSGELDFKKLILGTFRATQ
jgi:hypothetical protein